MYNIGLKSSPNWKQLKFFLSWGWALDPCFLCSAVENATSSVATLRCGIIEVIYTQEKFLKLRPRGSKLRVLPLLISIVKVLALLMKAVRSSKISNTSFYFGLAEPKKWYRGYRMKQCMKVESRWKIYIQRVVFLVVEVHIRGKKLKCSPQLLLILHFQESLRVSVRYGSNPDFVSQWMMIINVPIMVMINEI